MARPVLLLHGFASSFERNWREPGWVEVLEEAGRPVIGLDLLGHGEAPKPHDPQAYSRLDLQVADVLPAEAVDAIGFSLGADVLLRTAIQSPGAFGKIVVAGVGANLLVGGSSEAPARAVEAGQASEQDPPEAQALARFARSAGNDPAALAACLRRPGRPISSGDLRRVACPVLVVIGERDFAGPAEPLVEALPDARLVLLRGVDHFGTVKDFRFMQAALEFLET